MFAVHGAATALIGMLFWLQHRGIFSTFLALTPAIAVAHSRAYVASGKFAATRSTNFRFLSRDDRRRFLPAWRFIWRVGSPIHWTFCSSHTWLECRWIGVRHWPLRHSSASPRHSGFLPRPPLECRKVALFFYFTFSVLPPALAAPTLSSAVRCDLTFALIGARFMLRNRCAVLRSVSREKLKVPA